MTDPKTVPLSVLLIGSAEARGAMEKRLAAAQGWTLAVGAAAGGAEALEVLRRAFYDLIFLDGRLAGEKPMDLLDRLRQLYPKSAVVVVRGAGGEAEAVEAMKRGALDYLTAGQLEAFDPSHAFHRVIERRYLVDQNMELRQVNEMKNEFIANISHELRTPLTVVIGYAETLKDEGLGPVSAAQKKALESIAARAEELLRTLNQILRLRDAKEGRETLTLKPLELAGFLAARASRLPRDFEKRAARLETRLPREEVWIMADAEKLAVVVDNLLANAAKFGPQGGAVTLTLSAGDGAAALEVHDSGPGIPPEMLTRVFEGFGAAEAQGPTREYGGLGLGLAVSRQIIEGHGGKLWLESKPSAGTSARLSLPLSSPDSPEARVEGKGRLKKRLLIVEDNADLVEILMLFLSGAGQNLEVDTARSGGEALDKLKARVPDLLILDIMMPGMSGLEVIERLRKAPETKDLPVLVLTGYAEAAEKARGHAQDVLLKPFEKHAFLSKISRLLGGKKNGA